jgi:hypothetical protein
MQKSEKKREIFLYIEIKLQTFSRQTVSESMDDSNFRFKMEEES